MNQTGLPVYLILHDLRSAHNVGAIFRTADAAGINKIYLTGYTPAPIDSFGREMAGLTKASLGAEKTVAWEKVETAEGVLSRLKAEGCRLVAVEQSDRAIDYKEVDLRRPAAIVLGNEVDGIPVPILDRCDLIAEIPMRGLKESLNVSVAAGIVLYRWLVR